MFDFWSLYCASETKTTSKLTSFHELMKVAAATENTKYYFCDFYFLERLFFTPFDVLQFYGRLE